MIAYLPLLAFVEYSQRTKKRQMVKYKTVKKLLKIHQIIHCLISILLTIEVCYPPKNLANSNKIVILC